MVFPQPCTFEPFYAYTSGTAALSRVDPENTKWHLFLFPKLKFLRITGLDDRQSTCAGFKKLIVLIGFFKCSPTGCLLILIHTYILGSACDSK